MIVPAGMDALGAERSALARSVAADLEAIFGPAADPPADRGAAIAGAKPDRRPPAIRSTPRSLTAATVGALAAAALTGIAAGSLVKFPTTAEAGPAPSPALPIVVAAATPGPLASSIADAANRTAAIPAKARVQARPVRARTPARTHARSRVPARARMGDRDCCSYAAVTAADRRLRTAYDRAIRAGVPNPVLADYRDRWARERRASTHEPGRLVGRYGELARGLVREAEAAQSRRQPRSLETRWSLRPRYAPWWS